MCVGESVLLPDQKSPAERLTLRTAWGNYALTAPPNGEGCLLPEVPGRGGESGGFGDTVLARLALP